MKELCNTAQAARKRQAQTLQQALAGVTMSEKSPHHARALPHIYGSAEYLQDSQVRCMGAVGSCAGCRCT